MVPLRLDIRLGTSPFWEGFRSRAAIENLSASCGAPPAEHRTAALHPSGATRHLPYRGRL
jgi:hypothetical protein